MKDCNGKDLHIGELVSVINHPELSLQCNWIIVDFIDFGTNIDCILEQATTKEIRFINLMDVQRQF
jgi:hypothetical protein